MAAAATIAILAVPGIPLIAPGDDLAASIAQACAQAGLALVDGDVVVVAQKIVSKAEGRAVRLADVDPSPAATELARTVDKDPRLVELILGEAAEVVRAKPGVLIVEHRLGMILANAGIDASNVDHRDGETALLLPRDPDASAKALREGLAQRCAADVAVLVVDSIGRAWRGGTIGTTIGASGLPTLLDLRGRPDLYGRALATTELGYADEVAAAASLAMGQADEARPVAIVRGLAYAASEAGAKALLRPRAMDLFR